MSDAYNLSRLHSSQRQGQQFGYNYSGPIALSLTLSLVMVCQYPLLLMLPVWRSSPEFFWGRQYW